MEICMHARDTVPETLTRFARSDGFHGDSCPGGREALPFNSMRWEFNVQQRRPERHCSSAGTPGVQGVHASECFVVLCVCVCVLCVCVCVRAAGRRYPNGWLSRDRITCLLQSWQAVLPHRGALSAPHTPNGLEATRWMLELPAPALDRLSAVSSSWNFH